MTAPEPVHHSRFNVAALVCGLVAAILIVVGTANFARGHTLFGLAWIVGGAGFVLAALGAFHRAASWRVTTILCWAASIALHALWLGMK